VLTGRTQHQLRATRKNRHQHNYLIAQPTQKNHTQRTKNQNHQPNPTQNKHQTIPQQCTSQQITNPDHRYTVHPEQKNNPNNQTIITLHVLQQTQSPYKQNPAKNLQKNSYPHHQYQTRTQNTTPLELNKNTASTNGTI